MKKRKRKPTLMISIMTSILLVSAASTVSANGIYQKYNTDGNSQPAVAVLMQGLSQRNRLQKDEKPENALENRLLAQATLDFFALPPTPSTPAVSPDQNGSMGDAFEETGQTGESDQNGTDQGGGPTATPLPEEQVPTPEEPSEPMRYEFTEVTQEYFDDALFIGDSRAVGIQLYSGWNNLTYYAESGMTVYNMFKREITLADGTKTTIEEALKEETFGKIYLEIGINEMGTGTVDSFMKAYEEAVQHLRELQPEADLFLCGIMYVRKSKSDSDPIFNNPSIKERNERIAQLADQNSIFYLEINEVTSDETGNLNPEYTWDEIHLLGKYNVLWTDYLSKHGIVKTSSQDHEAQMPN